MGDILFISFCYFNEVIWREEVLKELLDYFDIIFLENFGYEFYIEVFREIVSLINEWFVYF